MLYKDIDMMFSDDWYNLFIKTKPLYDKRMEDIDCHDEYLRARKELKDKFERRKMLY